MADEQGTERVAEFLERLWVDHGGQHLDAVAGDPDVHAIVKQNGGLIGGVQFCVMLGIPHAQRGNLYRLAGLPEPLGTTERGKVWLRSDAEAFAAERRQRKGDGVDACAEVDRQTTTKER